MTDPKKAYTSVSVDCFRIGDWASFHDSFAEQLGFPKFYGRNMDAWIDCLSSIDCKEDGMTTVHAPPDGFLVLRLRGARDLNKRCPEIYDALIECSAFVNYRRQEVGDDPVLLLSFHD